jgi:ADP-heptose:LPS heptosyltransferase
LGDRLLQAYPQTRILIFGGPEEEDLKKEINDRIAGECAIVSHLSLRATAALIKQCRVFVSNDSGLLHVAAAVKTPSVGLFGPTNPITNGPYGGGHAVLTRDLDCRPCCPVLKLRRRGRFTPTCDERICLTRLRVTRVFEAVEPIIRKRSGQTSDIDGLSIQEKPKGRD